MGAEALSAADSGNQYLVLANEDAGDDDAAEIRAAVERLAEAGPTSLRWTASVEEVGAAILGAPEETTFVAAGGDGTIHGLINALHARGRLNRPVGLLPVGTGNDLARNVGLPEDPVAAADAIRSGTRRRIALVEHRGEVVVNNAHVGLGAVGARRAEGLKKYLGALAYAAATLRAIFTYDEVRLRLTLDGDVIHDGPCTAAAVAVAGTGVGGGRPVMPTSEFASSPTDMSVIVVGALGRWDRLRLPVRVGRGDVPAGMQITRGSRLEWEHDGPLAVDVDGQLGEWPAEGTLEISGSWEILGSEPAAA